LQTIQGERVSLNISLIVLRRSLILLLASAMSELEKILPNQ
jgi:hypothetical protein